MKKTASDRRKKVKELERKMFKDRSGAIVNLGVDDESKKYLRFKTETTKKKLKLVEKTTKLKNKGCSIKRRALEATSRLEVAKANTEMMELLEHFKTRHPMCAAEELNSIFPLS